MRDFSAVHGRRARLRSTAAGAAALVMGLLVPLVLVGTSAVANAAGTCADLGTGLGDLCVESSANGSTTPPYDTGIQAGDRIGEFHWLVTEDNTGDPSLTPANAAACLPARAALADTIYAGAGQPGADGRVMSDCPWPSIHAVEGHSAQVATGDQHDVDRLASLPDGKYLVSTTADGFKIDGVHFEVRNHALYTVNETRVGLPGGRFVVRMNPLPKKTATVRVHVYNDNAATNGQWDGQTETLVTCDVATPQQLQQQCGGRRDANLVADPSTDMSGFTVSINDVLATVTTDVYGNPLCTQYLADDQGVILDEGGAPTPIVFGNGGTTGGFLAGTDSTCISDHYGDVVIPNMGPNRYAVSITPPDPRTHDGVQWVQTTTLEGGHDWDSWNIEGGTGYDTELIVGGERVTPVAHGFVRLTHNDDVWKAQGSGESGFGGSYYDAAPGFTGGQPGQGVLKGRLRIGRAYIGSGMGAPLAGMNLTNAKDDGPIEDGLVSISCLATCNAPTDTTVWTGRARASDGSFEVHGLQTGDYSVALWDETQSYILAAMQYHVEGDTGAPATDAGDVLLSGWFTDLQGSIFVDSNGDGVRQPSEKGVPDFGVTVRTRGNSLQDQGAAASVTNDAGDFDLSQAYPLGQFLVFEAYNPRYKTTGITYDTDNDGPHTVLTSQVDFDFLPIIGLSAKIDVGVQPYDQGENGGIAGTVTYDVTRNELDPAYSAQEDYQPGIPGIPMQLWKSHTNPDGSLVTYSDGAAVQVGVSRSTGQACDRPDALRGTDAVAEGQDCLPWDYYVTESWTRPTGCTALDVNGNPLEGQLALPDYPATIDYSHTDPTQPDCIESPMNGFQIGGDGSVDGNYALSNLVKGSAIAGAPAGGQALADFYADKDNAGNWDTLVPADYLVEAVNPVDAIGNPTVANPDPDQGGYVGGTTPKHVYRFTDETSIDVFSGDTYVPQEGFHGPAAGADAGFTLGAYDGAIQRQDLNSLGAGTAAKCAGALQTIDSSANPDFAAVGGSPFEGQRRNVCDTKLVKVVNGRSVNPTFFMYTDVPIPAKFFGLLNDDLNVQTDRRSILLGEVAPVPNAPIGIYDELGNWKYTAHSDFNGNYEVILPSMDTFNCPLPAGPCPNVYRLVGNDPGTLDHRNLDYNPQFRTIATEFQAWTGVTHPVDQAPTHQGITIEGPAAQFGALSLCQVNQPDTPADKVTPEIFAIDKPYYDPAADGSRQYVLDGAGFGTDPGQLLVDSSAIAVVSWTDHRIVFTFPGSFGPGRHQLAVKSANGLKTVNGLTFHRLGSGYLTINDVYEVRSNYADGSVVSKDNESGHPRTYTPVHDAWDTVTNTPSGFAGNDVNGLPVTGGRAIQRAIEAAHGNSGSSPKLIVIYPNTAANYASHNPDAAYFENLVVHGRVMLQGVGPGGSYSSTELVRGTVLDASLYWAASQAQPAGTNLQDADGNYSTDWRTWANGLNRAGSGPADLPEGEAILAIAERNNQYANLQTVGSGNNARLNLSDSALASLSPAKTGVDGMVIKGGDQQGNPGNINTAPGAAGQGNTTPTNPGPAQGGAITLDQYVRDFQITNNLIESNGGSYGTVRIGTPDLGVGRNAQHNHNEFLTVRNNRFVANGGTNLAGALGIFYGADRYRVTDNDFCGNFSAEYGGAISHYGASAGGLIARNRIYYNQGYDEGGGIMIAGNLPANNNSLSDGAGGRYANGSSTQSIITAGVTLDGNTLISNQSNDDGGGIRFLMAGNFPFLVENNVVANNLSTHEGAGIALDDAPQVTIVNNTIVKNITTATAATNSAIGDGNRPANPAGLSTGGNSPQLQATLPDHSPNWSRPTLINNLFADNRAGWAVLPTTANFNTTAIRAIGDPTDSTPVQRWDVGLSGTTGLCNDVSLNGSLPDTCAQAFDANNNFTGVNNTFNTSASLSETNPDAFAYSVASQNIDPTTDGTGVLAFVHATDFVVDSLGWRTNTNVSFPVIVAHFVPATLLADYHLTDASSTQYAIGVGSAVSGAVPNHDIDQQSRPQGGGVERGADEIQGPAPEPQPLPALNLLDNFNRANSFTLGTNWRTLANISIGITGNTAGSLFGGQALWYNPSVGYGAKQAASFTIMGTLAAPGSALILKASGGTAAAPSTFLRVRVTGTGVAVESTTNSGGAYTPIASFDSGGFSANDVLTALVNADGSVEVWRNTTYYGKTATTSFTGSGRIGIQLPALGSVDNFNGGSVA